MKTTLFGLLAALVLAGGFAVGGWFIGHGYYAAHYGDRYVSVKGLAERNVQADMAIWQLRFVASGNELGGVQATIKKEAATVSAFLQAQGIAKSDVELQSLSVTDREAQLYSGSNGGDRFIIAQTLLVHSRDVKKIATASQHLEQLVDQGVILDTSNGGDSGPSYLYTRLNQIKPEMIAAATKAARTAAAQFAKDSGATLGGIRRADQGLFQILARNNAPGLNVHKQIDKTVRVVSHVQYGLEH